MIKLQEYRERRRMTQEQLSAASGITQQAISAIESGRNKSPRISTLYALANAMRCTVDDLIEIPEPAKKAE